MAVTPDDIAVELGRATPTQDSPQYQQWQSWISRTERTIKRRADQLGVPFASLDPEVVDDVVIYAVVRRNSRPPDGAESTTDQVSVDDGSLNRTRRYGSGVGDMHILDTWWADLGLSLPVGEWSGSISYSRGR